MKVYTKTIDNRQVIKPANKIVINKSGIQTINPTHEMIIEDGWLEYVVPTHKPTEEELLRRTKDKKRKEILKYDSSDEVNVFYIGEYQLWLDKATRVGLKLRFDAEIANGQTNTTLWYEGTPFNLELVNAVQMLNAIELYASACYDNTQAHIANVKALDDEESVKQYDYKVGYPEYLKF